jgi:hypothetical protein
MRNRYIGVTGVMAQAESAELGTMFRGMPNTTRGNVVLALGVLATQKTLAGLPPKRPSRYPPREAIAEIIDVEYLGVQRIVHYCTDTVHVGIADEIARALAWAGVGCTGIQINAPTIPDLRGAGFLAGRRVIQQVRVRNYQSPHEAADALAPYVGSTVSDVLLDFSAGEGVPIDIDRALDFVDAFRSSFAMLGIGIAGGLDAEKVRRLSPVIYGRRLSVDAESLLRTPDDRLDMAKARAYVAEALTAYGPRPVALGAAS